MVQDSRGYLWFATNQGICRFNGYEFIRPEDTSAMRGGAAFIPTEDPKGNIWFTHLDHSIQLVENDTVRTWRYNHLIDQYRGKFLLIENIAFGEDGTVWLALKYLGLLMVRPDGTYRLVGPEMEDPCLIFTSVGENLIWTLNGNKLSDPKIGQDSWNWRVVLWQNGRSTKIENLIFEKPDLFDLGSYPFGKRRFVIF
ncbi:MAG: hypothetical protein IPH04_01270 [Saprospirales bacterium]|nr:hypothetical protein [Saprospirales bacterium]